MPTPTPEFDSFEVKLILLWVMVRNNILRPSQYIQDLARHFLGWLPQPCHNTLYNKGFTLAELLTVVGVLGVIATFTIPKMLTAQNNQKYKAMAKEAGSVISQAYQLYSLSNVPGTTTTPKSVLQYFNQIKYLDSTVNLTDTSGATFTCFNATAGQENCVLLPNGGVIGLDTQAFPSTATTSLIWFWFDPDGAGPTAAMKFALYFNGKILDEGNLLPGSTSGYGAHSAWPANVPAWFNWT